jgi:hypothetical protein
MHTPPDRGRAIALMMRSRQWPCLKEFCCGVARFALINLVFFPVQY